MFDILSPLLAFSRLFNAPSYGETLEHYIVTRQPQDISDVEKLETEWQRMQGRGWFNV